jgi:hypothetical protein
MTMGLMAERQGFEPWVRKRTTVFETAPFDHSGTSPQSGKAVVGNRAPYWKDKVAASWLSNDDPSPLLVSKSGLL